jgi:hypothetical protein
VYINTHNNFSSIFKTASEIELKTNLFFNSNMESSSLPELPIDHVNIIKEMACIRKSNKKKGNNFIVVCRIKAPLNKVIAKEVREWLFSRLNLIQHPAVWDSCQYDWNILIDNYGTENEMEYNKDDGEQIMFLIHTGGSHGGMDKDGLIFENEKSEYYEMSADYLLEHMGGEPEYVVGVGISAVSPKFMSEKWWDEIEGHNGFMSKPMWNKWGGGATAATEWNDACEKSFNFGWKNYPPLDTVQIDEIHHHLMNFDDGDTGRIIQEIKDTVENIVENIIEHGDVVWCNEKYG